jgi:hypothetical protein
VICTLIILGHIFTFKHLCLHSITKILRNGPKAHFPFNCPVRHPIEGKISLPRLSPTAPSCLGAKKGTPRRMEELPKHSLSNLILPHSVSTHLIDRVSDLSSILVVNSLCFILSSSLGLCACVCYGFVCVAPQPYSMPSL